MPHPITVQVVSLHPAVLRAATFLRNHPRLRVNVIARSGATTLPSDGVLRIEPGSRLEPVLTLLWGGYKAPAAEVQRSARVGLSAAVLNRGPTGYEWSGRARPLPSRSRFGFPDESRPWVLVAPHARVSRDRIAALTGLSDPQLHYLSPRPAAIVAGSVCWLPTRHVLLSLLGRVHAVVASQGPLAWDAARLGVPVFEPEPVRALSAASVERRLSSMVPAKLLGDREFWECIGSQLADGASDWGTVAWTLRARGAHPKPVGLLASAWPRKLLKLRRDPVGFWSDSKVLKRFKSAGI